MKIFLLLILLLSAGLAPCHGAWWWPFGSSKSSKPELSPMDKPKPIKESTHAPRPEDKPSVERLEKMAKEGNPNAQLALGKIYFEGLVNKKPDHKKAFKLFMAAAVQDSPQAMFNVGLCYDGGFGVNKNLLEAMRWYHKAADAGVPEAQINAAIAAEQRGDYQTAMKYLRLRAAQGDTPAMYKVAIFLLNGLGEPTNPAEAVSYLLEASRRGNSRAQVRLADCYQQGLGIERNYAEMFNWLTLAAQDGDPEAQTKLGYCYQKGYGTKPNADLAFSWFKNASAAAYGPSYIYLGDCYRYGDGTACDLGKAFECYRAAAEQAEAIGAFNLAIAYSDGIGTQKDATEALRWMRKAAEQGLAFAQIQLGLYLQQGYGLTAPAPKEAIGWFEKAAEQQEPLAMLQLATCYLQGIGTPVDLEAARKWLSQAAAGGNRQAISLYSEHFGSQP